MWLNGLSWHRVKRGGQYVLRFVQYHTAGVICFYDFIGGGSRVPSSSVLSDVILGVE